MHSPWRCFTAHFVVVIFIVSASSPFALVQTQLTSSGKTVVPSSTTRDPTSSSVASRASSSVPGIPPAATHTVQVGLADHKFNPDTLRTAAGDTVEFQFFPQNHSVVRAEEGIPCIPYEMTGPGKAGNGFFSGFRPVSEVLDNPPTWRLLINDTSPMFFYCSAPGSCTIYGMVGIINPNASTKLADQRARALKADYQLSPGEPFPAESPTPTPSPQPSSGPHGSPSTLSAGAIAGIAVASVGVVALAGLLFFCGRFKGLKDEVTRKDSTIVRTSSPRSPRLGFWGTGVGPGAEAPMSTHAKASAVLPPAYFDAEGMGSPYQGVYVEAPGTVGAAGGGGGGHHGWVSAGADGAVNRSASHRSVGGTFDLDKGYFTRTHEAGVPGFMYTGDMTSPTDPTLVRGEWGAVGRQRRSPTSSPSEQPMHQVHGPVELPDTSISQKPGMGPGVFI